MDYRFPWKKELTNIVRGIYRSIDSGDRTPSHGGRCSCLVRSDPTILFIKSENPKDICMKRPDIAIFSGHDPHDTYQRTIKRKPHTIFKVTSPSNADKDLVDNINIYFFDKQINDYIIVDVRENVRQIIHYQFSKHNKTVYPLHAAVQLGCEIIWLWCFNITSKTISWTVGCPEATTVDLSNFLREVCTEKLNVAEQMGIGEVVQIDESLFRGKQKCRAMPHGFGMSMWY
ncbi:unnamed protein product [Didymodactylos carnosus]|uniref:Uncharacterized protein n=1 Tax=Didymodactylos carnosus TaxID=1234261 RepID=A0A815Q1X4_9BILA|nr:unnamed protein product [Didymodactylos carnosus]CAF4328389.1 unnamed protein product [Didymodactylos carnosus]